jgi:hypothetical protein
LLALGEEDVNTFLTIMELFIQGPKEPLLHLLFPSIIMIFHQKSFLVDKKKKKGFTQFVMMFFLLEI